MQRAKGIALAGLVAIAPAWAQDATPAPVAGTARTEAGCPPPKTVPPRYPHELLRRNKGGTVLLDLSIDACGRVLQASVKKPSGHRALDEAAQAAAMQSVLSPDERARAVNGHVERPIGFAVDPRTYTFPQTDWPSTHKRPRYVLEPLAGYADVAAANTAIKSGREELRVPPYPMSGRFIQLGSPGAREFWLFIHKGQEASLAARYRPVMEDGEAVVRLAVLCSDAPDACAKAQALLLKGLPFAKAKR